MLLNLELFNQKSKSKLIHIFLWSNMAYLFNNTRKISENYRILLAVICFGLIIFIMLSVGSRISFHTLFVKLWCIRQWPANLKKVVLVVVNMLRTLVLISCIVLSICPLDYIATTMHYWIWVEEVQHKQLFTI